jgi:cytochrome c556
MTPARTLTALALGAALLAGTALAESHGSNPAVKARQSHMQLYAHNIGVLGAMVKGEVDYGAEAAVAAAGNLAALSQLDQRTYWPQGTDSDTLDGTRALPAIWNDFPDILTKAKALTDAAVALEATAGDGLDALKAGFGPVGGACGACHKAYQKPRE